MLWSAHRRNGALGAGCEATVELRTLRGYPRVGCGRGQRTLGSVSAKGRVAMPLDEDGRTDGCVSDTFPMRRARWGGEAHGLSWPGRPTLCDPDRLTRSQMRGDPRLLSRRVTTMATIGCPPPAMERVAARRASIDALHPLHPLQGF